MFIMPTLNQTTIAGRLTRDPEMKQTVNGKNFARLSIAVDNHFQKGGEWEKDTFYITLQCWEYVAEKVVKNGFKGAPVIVTGRLNVSKWTDQNGVEKTNPEIIADRISVLEWQDKQSQPNKQSQTQTQTQHSEGGDVPF